MAVIVFCANSLFAPLSNAQSTPAVPESKNSRMTTEAWDAFNASHFDVAIAKAEECIIEFRRAAAKLQDDLKKDKEPDPPIGDVKDADLKKKMFSWGPLNDVAACHFIIGEANVKLARRAEDKKKGNEYLELAKKAYGEAAKLTYARVWDLGGWFWNPATTAKERIEDMPPIRP